MHRDPLAPLPSQHTHALVEAGFLHARSRTPWPYQVLLPEFLPRVDALGLATAAIVYIHSIWTCLAHVHRQQQQLESQLERRRSLHQSMFHVGLFLPLVSCLVMACLLLATRTRAWFLRHRTSAWIFHCSVIQATSSVLLAFWGLSAMDIGPARAHWLILFSVMWNLLGLPPDPFVRVLLLRLAALFGTHCYIHPGYCYSQATTVGLGVVKLLFIPGCLFVAMARLGPWLHAAVGRASARARLAAHLAKLQMDDMSMHSDGDAVETCLSSASSPGGYLSSDSWGLYLLLLLFRNQTRTSCSLLLLLATLHCVLPMAKLSWLLTLCNSRLDQVGGEGGGWGGGSRSRLGCGPEGEGCGGGCGGGRVGPGERSAVRYAWCRFPLLLLCALRL